MSYRYFFIILIALNVSCSKINSLSESVSFSNPLLPVGPDPWVIQKDSSYYYTNTLGDRITIWKTKSMSRLSAAESKTVWLPPPNSPNSYDLWAPELHYLDGKWYIYYAADATPNHQGQRIFVLENASQNPLEGTWTDKGKIADPENDIYSIDPTILELNNKRYLIWSSLPADNYYKQTLFIAQMKNPWTLSSSRKEISTPQYSWEKVGFSEENGSNEGPEVLVNSKGHVFLTYSASSCGTDGYAIGIMSLNDNSDPMIAANWVKNPSPVLTTDPISRAYGPGHNAFFKSPDGKENWIIYHANSTSHEGCGNFRNPRIQKFTWDAEGNPIFGQPISILIRFSRPSGEKTNFQFYFYNILKRSNSKYIRINKLIKQNKYILCYSVIC